jgi:hypothetical protein
VRFQPGEANPHWRGDSASYSAFHKRVVAARGPADHCSLNCNSGNTRYEWANLTGHYEDVNDFAMMCRPCHFKYDGKVEAQQGSKNPLAKLTEGIVLEARRRFAAGERQRALAREYGVSPAALCQAISGKNWGWLTDGTRT